MRIDSIISKDMYDKYIHIRKQTTDEKVFNSTDKAELTESAQTFSSAFKAAQESLGARTAEETQRVEQVAEQIKNGTYSVPAEAVAEKMLGI